MLPAQAANRDACAPHGKANPWPPGSGSGGGGGTCWALLKRAAALAHVEEAADSVALAKGGAVLVPPPRVHLQQANDRPSAVLQLAWASAAVCLLAAHGSQRTSPGVLDQINRRTVASACRTLLPCVLR